MGLWPGRQLDSQGVSSGVSWEGPRSSSAWGHLVRATVTCTWCHLCWAWRRLGEAELQTEAVGTSAGPGAAPWEVRGPRRQTPLVWGGWLARPTDTRCGVGTTLTGDSGRPPRPRPDAHSPAPPRAGPQDARGSGLPCPSPHPGGFTAEAVGLLSPAPESGLGAQRGPGPLTAPGTWVWHQRVSVCPSCQSRVAPSACPVVGPCGEWSCGRRHRGHRGHLLRRVGLAPAGWPRGHCGRAVSHGGSRLVRGGVSFLRVRPRESQLGLPRLPFPSEDPGHGRVSCRSVARLRNVAEATVAQVLPGPFSPADALTPTSLTALTLTTNAPRHPRVKGRGTGPPVRGLSEL